MGPKTRQLQAESPNPRAIWRTVTASGALCGGFTFRESVAFGLRPSRLPAVRGGRRDLSLLDELRPEPERFPVEPLIAETRVDFDVPLLRRLIDDDHCSAGQALQ